MERIAYSLKLLYEQFKKVLVGHEASLEVAETLLCEVLAALFPSDLAKNYGWEWLWDEGKEGILYVISPNEVYAINLYSDDPPLKVDPETEQIVREQLVNYIPPSEK